MITSTALVSLVAFAPATSLRGFSLHEVTSHGPELSQNERQFLVQASASLLRHQPIVEAVTTLPQLFADLEAAERAMQDPSAPIQAATQDTPLAIVTSRFPGEPQTLRWSLPSPSARPNDSSSEGHAWGGEQRPFAPPRLTGRSLAIDPKVANFDGGGIMLESDFLPPCGLSSTHLEELLTGPLLPSPEAYWQEAKISYPLARQLAPVVSLARKPDPFSERRYDYGGYFNSDTSRAPDTYDPAPGAEAIPENFASQGPQGRRTRMSPPPRHSCDELTMRPARDLIRGAIDRYGGSDLRGVPGIATLAQDLRVINGCYHDRFSQFDAAINIMDRLASLAPELRATCSRRRGRFEEIRGAGNHLELLVCRSASGQRLGAFLRWHEDGRIAAAYAMGKYEVRLSASPGSDTIRLYGDLGPELVFDTELRPRLLRARAGGPTTEWYASGRMLLHDDGKQETIWYENGRAASRLEFDDKHDWKRSRKWHPNGRLAEDIVFVQGLPDGDLRWWHDNGRPAGHVRFVKGTPDGRAELYFADGRPGFKANYRRGELYGDVTYLHPDGSLALSGQARDSEWNGELIVRFAADYPLFARKFRRGKPAGSWIDYNPLAAGKPLRMIQLDSDGRISGTANAYNVHGKLKSSCKIVRGRITQVLAWHSNLAPLLVAKRQPNKNSFRLEVASAKRQPLFACQGIGFKETTASDVARINAGHCRIHPMLLRDIKRLGDQALFMHYAGQDATPWRPQACGGYVVNRREQRSSLREFELNHALAVERITFTTRKLCPPSYANQLTCIVHYLETGPKVQSCSTQ